MLIYVAVYREKKYYIFTFNASLGRVCMMLKPGVIMRSSHLQVSLEPHKDTLEGVIRVVGRKGFSLTRSVVYKL